MRWRSVLPHHHGSTEEQYQLCDPRGPYAPQVRRVQEPRPCHFFEDGAAIGELVPARKRLKQIRVRSEFSQCRVR
ncbi:protein of unknown function [Cupriavidus taiwanensis]|nr:protein of unknown function [Cupriavidus taiwanensis]